MGSLISLDHTVFELVELANVMIVFSAIGQVQSSRPFYRFHQTEYLIKSGRVFDPVQTAILLVIIHLLTETKLYQKVSNRLSIHYQEYQYPLLQVKVRSHRSDQPPVGSSSTLTASTVLNVFSTRRARYQSSCLADLMLVQSRHGLSLYSEWRRVQQ